MPSTAVTTTTPTTSTPITKTNADLRCGKLDCNVMKIVESTPKTSKEVQFVIDAKIAENPIPINTLTSVFTVMGSSAKLGNIKKSDGTEMYNKLYRIKPNTHAHVVNYVVVDADITTKQPFKTNDPAIKKQLLNAQKKSATQILTKLMKVEGYDATSSTNKSTAPDTNNQSNISAHTESSTDESPISVKIVPKLKKIENKANTEKPKTTINLNTAPVQLQNILCKKGVETTECKIDNLTQQVDSLKKTIEYLLKQQKLNATSIEGPKRRKRIQLN